ncbi:class I glutamine amidotransferase-like protein [Violaceomyces palustris]|uniref:Class I glutamine amidotransferase-like protein n=1 Tax=Violaceomyces palustris TaxID=1673888 RepID=A0ACD0NWC6_9BASI|nr:class I glutamine amidotransferase-like protein [Violaceomyces palustris]
MSAPKAISIALLVADTPPRPVVEKVGDYKVIYPNFLESSLESVARHAWQEKVELQIRPYDVVDKMEYPDEGQLRDGLWDAIMITGSASSATQELAWNVKLAEFIRRTAEDHPLVRIIGICYGHQIIARAFGAKVEENEKGWELSTTEVELNEEGQELLNYKPDEGIMRIQQVHKDHVSQVPPSFQGEDFINLGSTGKSPIQALALRYPTEAPPLASTASTSAYMAFDISDSGTSSSGPSPVRSLHVLTFQGHPEFNQEIVELILSVKTEMGQVTGEKLEEALSKASLAHDGTKLGRVILNMLGVEAARTESGDEMINV